MKNNLEEKFSNKEDNNLMEEKKLLPNINITDNKSNCQTKTSSEK